ncbi:hypothetical protein [Azospirillum oryzae]|uniref:hypothetical protein n=1 Tax=Azospirillum oryzae TaxID=286727 RepID=UPI0011782309|nr:hypothetical protein [Azospirillum oryzae]
MTADSYPGLVHGAGRAIAGECGFAGLFDSHSADGTIRHTDSTACHRLGAAAAVRLLPPAVEPSHDCARPFRPASFIHLVAVGEPDDAHPPAQRVQWLQFGRGENEFRPDLNPGMKKAPRPVRSTGPLNLCAKGTVSGAGTAG